VGSDPFQVLGLPPDATLTEARAAYRRLAELFHPDRLRGLREEVQAEGAQRMREATEAMRTIRERYNRPLVAPGRRRGAGAGAPPGTDPPGTERPTTRPPRDAASTGRGQERRTSTTQRTRAGAPAPAGRSPRTLRTPPSDAATEASAHLYHVQLRGLDGPGFKFNWGGRHAAATLAALRHAHTIDGPIRQFEWGSYEWVLDGAATRRLLWHVLEGEEWRRDPAEVVDLSADLRDRFLPARRDGDCTAVELGALLDVLDERQWYSVTAEVY
jgi:curved DNA-binding protein CbpA